MHSKGWLTHCNNFSPDPLVPGETATFFVQGPLSPPAQTGSELVIAFYDHSIPLPISTPF